MRILQFHRGEEERELADLSQLGGEPGDDELVWVDLMRDDPDLRDAITTLGMADAADRLERPSTRPELLRQDGIVIVSVLALRTDRDSADDRSRSTSPRAATSS